MQKALSIGSILVVLSVVVWNYYTKPNIVYLNNLKLVEEYVPYKKNKEVMMQKSKQLMANVDSLGMEFEKELKKYEKERATLSDKEKRLSEELLNNKQQQFLNYKEAIKKKLEEEDYKQTSVIVKDLQSFIKKYAEQHNYTFILGATDKGSVVYAKENVDITDEVIKEVNKAAVEKNK